MKSSMKLLFAGISLLAYIGFTSFISRSTQSPTTCAVYDTDLINAGGAAGSNYDWVWSVANPAPGNGSTCETLQNLSHWSIVLPACVAQSNIVSASYSNDGVSWINLSPIIAVDPSQDCYNGPVLKFDAGTTGSAPTYYKLTLNQNYSSGAITATFKSGSKTGCHTYADLVLGPSCDGVGTDR